MQLFYPHIQGPMILRKYLLCKGNSSKTTGTASHLAFQTYSSELFGVILYTLLPWGEGITLSASYIFSGNIPANQCI